jgi:diacylglycerol O-acyltransferase
VSDPRMEWADAVMFGVEEDPVLRSVITLVILLDSEPDEKLVRERIDRMSRMIPKLRQRAVGNPMSIAPPRWEVDPNFDIGYHLRWVRAPKSDSSIRPVFTLAEQMAEGDFDRARPLWEMLLVTGLDNGQAAFITKIHHAVTDGVGGMQMAALLFDLDRKGAELGPMPEAPIAQPATFTERMRQGMSFEARTTVSDVKSAIGTGTGFVKDAVTDPLGVATSATEMASSLSRMLAPASEPMSTVFGERSLSVYFDLIDVPLAGLKKAGKSSKGTLNDAYIAGVVGGLRRYHERHGSLPDALRVNMPVNLRSPGDAGKQGNAWVPARFPVPMNESDPSKRIQQLHPVLRQSRTEPAAVLTDQVFRLLTMLPRSISTVVAGNLMKGTDFVATNVPGPPIPVFFAGTQILRILPYAPKAGAAVNCALMSYNGIAQIGVNIDRVSVPNPGELVDDLRAGLEEVIALGEEPAAAATPPAAEKAPAKKPAAKKAPAKKSAAKKAPAKKSPAKKPAAKKA